MVSLLKTFGKGILYVIGFPFFIVALLIFGAVGVFLFIIQLFKSIIYFFTGQKFFPELPEDKELRLKQEAAYAAANPPVMDDAPVYEEPMNMEEEPPVFIRHTPFYNEPQPPVLDPIPDPDPVPEPVQESISEPVQEEETVEQESVEEACFEQPEEEKEEPREDVFTEQENDKPEHTIDISEPKEEEVEEEELEEYVPRGSTYVEEIDDDEEDTKTGVDIDYDVR